VGFLGGEGP